MFTNQVTNGGAFKISRSQASRPQLVDIRRKWILMTSPGTCFRLGRPIAELEYTSRPRRHDPTTRSNMSGVVTRARSSERGNAGGGAFEHEAT